MHCIFQSVVPPSPAPMLSRSSVYALDHSYIFFEVTSPRETSTSTTDTLFMAEYQVHCLDQHGGSLQRMFVCNVSGIEWGVLALMSGVEKPQCYTGQ